MENHLQDQSDHIGSESTEMDYILEGLTASTN